MTPIQCEHGAVVDWGDFGPDPEDGSVGIERCEVCFASPWDEKAICRDERLKLANLLEKHGDALTTYTNDDSNTLKLVVYMLRLDGEVWRR